MKGIRIGILYTVRHHDLPIQFSKIMRIVADMLLKDRLQRMSAKYLGFSNHPHPGFSLTDDVRGRLRCTRRGLTKKIYAYVYIFRKAPSRTWRVREGALQKYMLTYMFFVRPLLEHGVYEKVPCAHACARLSCLSFRALLTSG